MANHLPPGLACQNPTQVAGPASPRLTAKLTAKLADNRDPRRIALDGYIRPDLRRCDRRWLPKQLTSPRVESIQSHSTAQRHVASASVVWLTTKVDWDRFPTAQGGARQVDRATR